MSRRQLAQLRGAADLWEVKAGHAAGHLQCARLSVPTPQARQDGIPSEVEKS